MVGIVQELRHALRGLSRAPGFTTAALAILAVAIGANVAVYGIVDGLLLRPFPFGPGSDRIVTVHAVHPTQVAEWDDREMSWPDVEDVRRQSRALSGVSAYTGRSFNLSSKEGAAERVRGGSVTPGLFRTLGVDPVLGRHFEEAEAAAMGFEPVVLIGYGLWHRRFGGDPAVVGRTLVVNERALEVVGVMPRGFGFPHRDEMWVPYRPDGSPSRDARDFSTVARLAPGFSLAQAREELAALGSRLAKAHPDTNRDWSLYAIPFRDYAVSPTTRATAITLLVAVTLVLFIGCANLAALLLARGAGRTRELAIRAALGGGRLCLIRQMLVESVLLAVLGGALGALLARWGLEALIASWPEPMPFWVHVEVDGRCLGFAFLVTLATGVAIGLIPAFRGSRLDLVPVLAEQARAGSAGRSTQRLQSALVVGQIALSLGLLVGASLLLRSYVRLQGADPGFDAGRVAAFRFYLAGDAYDPPEAKQAFMQSVAQELGSLPGLAGVALTDSIPTDDGGFRARVVAEGGPAERRDEVGIQGIVTLPGFFEGLGRSLIEGRDFTAAESASDGPQVAIVNRALAGTLWPGESAIGKRVGLVYEAGPEWHTVVGVAPHVVYEELGEDTAQSRRNLYLPYGRRTRRAMAVLVRAEADPAPVLAAARAAFARLAPMVPIYDASTMTERRQVSTWGRRVSTDLLGGFALIAVLLACVGAYGVMAVGAGQRIPEIGIRLALGAVRRDVEWLLLRRGLCLAAAGTALGFPLAALAGEALSGMLFGVDPFEPAAWIALAGLLAAAVLLAAYLPARRAARTDPAVALRHE
jgi:predicted permease